MEIGVVKFKLEKCGFRMFVCGFLKNSTCIVFCKNYEPKLTYFLN